ncbi:MAG: Asp23/Gls24 family envelope stress response protein, partial [Clostridia bacterium]|nr:Asp23/Gls24 family envelope stress response protein [Clostridia bacterium]
MAQLKRVDGEETTLINKNMIVSVVSLATKEISGVVDMYHSKRLFFRRIFDRNIGQGVSIKYTKSGVYLDIYVVVDTECEVSDVVYRIQQNVKSSLSSVLP